MRIGGVVGKRLLVESELPAEAAQRAGGVIEQGAIIAVVLISDGERTAVRRIVRVLGQQGCMDRKRLLVTRQTAFDVSTQDQGTSSSGDAGERRLNIVV